MTNNCELCGEDAEILSPREANWTLKRVQRFLKRHETGSGRLLLLRNASRNIIDAMDRIQHLIEDEEIARPLYDESEED